MILETNDHFQLGKLRTSNDKLFTAKTCEHIAIGFVLPIYYLENVGRENEYFPFIAEDVFFEKMDEILKDHGTSQRHEMTTMKNDEKAQCCNNLLFMQ